MTLSPAQDDLLKALSKAIAQIVIGFGVLALQAWLLSICAGYFAPSFVLGFWQWYVVAGTFRWLVYSTNQTDK